MSVKRYDRDLDGNEVYPQNVAGDEMYLPLTDQNEIYARNKDGSARYAKERNGKEIYATFEGIPFGLRHPKGYPRYAKDAEGNEYYPFDPHHDSERPMADLKGNFVYARKRNNKEIYPKLSNGSEITPFTVKYAKGRKNIAPYYPKDENGNEVLIKNFYITNAKGWIVYPLDKDGNPIFPKDNKYLKQKNEEVYPKNIWGDEVVLPSNIYATDAQGNQKYPKTRDKSEFYVYTSEKEPVIIAKRYAKTATGDEFYPTYYGTKHQFMLYDDDRNPIFAQTLNGKEKYPQKPNGEEYSPYQSVYARDETGSYYYPRDENGNEKYLSKNLHLTQEDFLTDYKGQVRYIRNAGEDEMYPKDPFSEDEYYLASEDGKYAFAKDRNGHMRYARHNDGCERYPPDRTFMMTESGKPTYARDKDNRIVYPVGKDGREYYAKDPETESDIVGDRYVRHVVPVSPHPSHEPTNIPSDEVYPLETVSVLNGVVHKRQVFVNMQYARARDGTPQYPVDENGNEYTLEFDGSEENTFPLGYPITNDNKVIVPEVNGKPYLSNNLKPFVFKEDIVGRLYREADGYRDYLTDVESSRKSKSYKMHYQFKKKFDPSIALRKPKRPKKINVLLLVVIVVFAIVSLVLFIKTATNQKEKDNLRDNY